MNIYIITKIYDDIDERTKGRPILLCRWLEKRSINEEELRNAFPNITLKVKQNHHKRFPKSHNTRLSIHNYFLCLVNKDMFHLQDLTRRKRSVQQDYCPDLNLEVGFLWFPQRKTLLKDKTKFEEKKLKV